MSDPGTEGSYPQASSSKITGGKLPRLSVREGGSLTVWSAGDRNPLVDFAFDKLPTELLEEIFRHARPDNAGDAYAEEFRYPVALTQVCHHWRTVALGAPTLWVNVHIMDNYTERVKEAASIYLERSKACRLFLTWFSNPGHTHADAQEVIDDLIIPCAERWQRITLIANNEAVPVALLAVMGPLDFPVLRDIEISCLPTQRSSSELTLCRNAPLLRRCRFRNIHSLPPIPSNLVVLDCVALRTELINLDPLLEFLPHVAHSLEHLRCGPSTSEVSVISRRSRIPLENLKSLLVMDSHIIMDSILTPNLTYFAALHSPSADAQKVAEMFNGFSAPKLQSIRFHQSPLLPLLTSHDLPSMFPQLESATFTDCIDESAFALLLEPPLPKKPSSLKKASKYPAKHRRVENPFPKLKELTVSDIRSWTSFQAAIEKRLKNGDKSLRKIQLPMGDVPDAITRHLTQWLPKQGVELALYQSGEWSAFAPPEVQDDFCNELSRLFENVVEDDEWDNEDDGDDGYDYDDYPDFEFWHDRHMDRPDYELPNDYFGQPPFYDEEEEDVEDDFYYD